MAQPLVLVPAALALPVDGGKMARVAAGSLHVSDTMARPEPVEGMVSAEAVPLPPLLMVVVPSGLLTEATEAVPPPPPPVLTDWTELAMLLKMAAGGAGSAGEGERSWVRGSGAGGREAASAGGPRGIYERSAHSPSE